MARTLAAFGVVAVIAAVALAMGFGGGGPDVYTLHVIGNSSSGFAIERADKPVGDRYEASFGGNITWEFVNDTGEDLDIRVRVWEWMSTSACPVNFIIGGTGCQGELKNFPANASPRVIVATPREGSVEDTNNPYSFNIEIGPAGGNVRPIDPELQIDEDFLFGNDLLALIAAILAALFFGLSWWFSRRARTHASR